VTVMGKVGGILAVKNRRIDPSLELRPVQRLKLGLVGMAVIFASLGLGFAWIVMRLAKRIYEHRMLTTAKISQIGDRNYRIRHAVAAIPPVPFPAHQQAIRVIRDEVDRIEWELADIQSR